MTAAIQRNLPVCTVNMIRSLLMQIGIGRHGSGIGSGITIVRSIIAAHHSGDHQNSYQLFHNFFDQEYKSSAIVKKGPFLERNGLDRTITNMQIIRTGPS